MFKFFVFWRIFKSFLGQNNRNTKRRGYNDNRSNYLSFNSLFFVSHIKIRLFYELKILRRCLLCLYDAISIFSLSQNNDDI